MAHRDRSPSEPFQPTAAMAARDDPLITPRGATADIANAALDQIEWLGVTVHVPADVQITPSTCLHLMRVAGGGVELQIASSPTPVSAEQLLTVEPLGKQHMGSSPVIVTQYGLRYPLSLEGAAGESHRDYCLASFAELSYPLALPIVVEGSRRDFTLRDVLRDSIANFHLSQDELAWTAVAYASYLPPKKSWSNRYSEQFSFDDLARELVRRRLNEASCGGIHRLTALLSIVHAHRQCQVLSDEVSEQTHAYLKSVLALVNNKQAADGYWTVHWNSQLAPLRPTQPSPDDTASTRLTITGHMAEWLIGARAHFDVSDVALHKAVAWLQVQIAEVDPSTFWGQVCPYSHCLSAVAQYAEN